jgi:hypothetical protein
MIVALLIGMLVAGWLVLRDVRERTAVAPGPAAIMPIERASETRRALEAADRLKERRLEGAAHE